MQSLVIDALTEVYLRRINSRDRKSTKSCLEDFRSVMEEFIQAQNKFQTKRVMSPSSWDTIWKSSKFGGKQYFLEDCKDIVGESERRLSDDQILLRLKRKLEKEESQVRFTQWIEWVQLENPNAPKDPPCNMTVLR